MREKALRAISNSKDLESLQKVRVRYLGKQGEITAQLKALGQLPHSERKDRGAQLNNLKNELIEAFKLKAEQINNQVMEAQLAKESVDVTLPGHSLPQGGIHILTQTTNQLLDVFIRMGYEVVAGPELETDYYNFEALNFPHNHPARDSQDTFWTTDGRLLRTHTSPVQVRYMERNRPPFKIVVPGRVFRNEAVDVTHEAQFHQLEALVVGPNITMADMKGAISTMAKALFGGKVETRLQPSFFPFVEPGAEFAVRWENPKTGRSEWLELGGCGMVHPNILKAVGYQEVTGFAFGFGIERLALISHGIPDIRYFHQNDKRFLSQLTGGVL